MNLDHLVPGLAEQRATERRNRARAFSGITYTLCGVEVRPLTPRTRLRLELLRNAFLHESAEPMAGDVFQLLWLLSPHYGARFARWHQWRLRRHVRRMQLVALVHHIQAWIVGQMQDSPESRAGGNEGATDLSPWIHWTGWEAAFWLQHGGFTLETYFDTPYLVLQQLRRAWQANHPEITINKDGSTTVHEPQFINASDRLVGSWHRAHRDAVAERIRSQHEKRN